MNKQPRDIPIMLPVVSGEDKVVEAGINGVMTLIPRGVAVRVSQDLYDVLCQAGMEPLRLEAEQA